ncbi:MAG: alkene reductase [Crocinitomicaceae bacterium]|nr:alkene reductase [Crocinitomicaceae bacterium]
MKLLESFTLGELQLKNRIVMAPMTRSRANIFGVVGESTEAYYRQRSSAGLIVSEAINISEEAIGSPLTPGIYTKEQVNAWKKVTNAVHEADGKIIAQLWHTGRVGHSLVKNGNLPVAPSSIAIEGQEHFTMEGPKPYETPRELTVLEIERIIQEYKEAALNAIEAGFDGVELHAAFGYLPNQFLAESSNQRTDEYGGTAENRNRFVLKVMNALVEAVGEDKVGIRLSPTSTYNSIVHKELIAQFTLLIQSLNRLPLAYLHLMKVPFAPDKFVDYPSDVIHTLGEISNHTIIANCGYTKESGEMELSKGVAKLIAYGTLFIANPDLPKRFELNAPFNELDPSTMYGGNDKGYIDYPFLS